MVKKRRATRTSPFGSPGRISHDAAPFYASKLYADLQTPLTQTEDVSIETPLPSEAANRIFCASAEAMTVLPDACIHLMVTSPPYNVGKDYDADLSLDEYRAFLKCIWAEVHRVLVPGGRACINLANLGRKPYIPLHAYLIGDMLDLGFLMRGEIIWDKGASAAASTAWGSWRSPANPTLRDVHEYILVFCKGAFRRPPPDGRESTISRDQFLEYTKSVWTFPAASARKVGHPAPFPVELPYRLIQLYTYSGEVVLDPFMGSGQTALAALQAGRRFVGYEVDESYVRLAEDRLHRAEGGMPLDANSPLQEK
jgi:site-specific DNA-methyltransferase (adenine-specific)